MTLLLHTRLFSRLSAGSFRSFASQVPAPISRTGRADDSSVDIARPGGSGERGVRTAVAGQIRVRSSNRGVLTSTSNGCLALILILSGCATRSAPDFGGRWQNLNRYAAATEEIPLHQSYVFRASPMDGTLKTMLSRWAKDSNMTLSYLHPSDFTLHEPVSKVMTGDIQVAVTQVTAAYAGKMLVTTYENTIIVRTMQADTQASTPTP